MNSYTQDDPHLKPIPLAQYPWVTLPNPLNPEAIVKLCIIPTSEFEGPQEDFTSFKDRGEKTIVPCWSFLIEKGDEAILWDMGLRSVRSVPAHTVKTSS